MRFAAVCLPKTITAIRLNLMLSLFTELELPHPVYDGNVKRRVILRPRRKHPRGMHRGGAPGRADVRVSYLSAIAFAPYLSRWYGARDIYIYIYAARIYFISTKIKNSAAVEKRNLWNTRIFINISRIFWETRHCFLLILSGNGILDIILHVAIHSVSKQCTPQKNILCISYSSRTFADCVASRVGNYFWSFVYIEPRSHQCLC